MSCGEQTHHRLRDYVRTLALRAAHHCNALLVALGMRDGGVSTVAEDPPWS
jgi:hypothetical protein